MNYKKVYDQIVERAKSQDRRKGGSIYYEGHHILPECMGGDGKAAQWKWHPNIVLLTAREHFICHWLLVRIHPGNQKIAHAFWGMCNQEAGNQKRHIPSSRVYQEAREIFSSSVKGSNNPMFNKGYLIAGERHGMYGKGYLISGEKHGMYGKTGDKNPTSKKVKQYSRDGKSLIKIYGGIAEAAREVGTYGSDISKCCKGNQKSAGGYKWEYVLEEQVN